MLFKNTFPICFLDDSKLLVFKKHVFQIVNLKKFESKTVTSLGVNLFDLLIYNIPLLFRLLRKGVRCGISVDDNIVLVLIGKTIYELDLLNKFISAGYNTLDNSRPLIFSKIEGIKGFEDGIYFGGYKGNDLRDPIAIYKRENKDKWVKVYEFKKGEIEHIHNIIADPFKDIVYIFSGDQDNAACIWKVENNFQSVVPIMRGNQDFRSCVGFPTISGLIYATDSPYSNNSIRLLTCNNNSWESKPIKNINGPCIYGCVWNDDYVFSTSVEGSGQSSNYWSKFFGTKRGPGIIENYSVIYKGNLDKPFKEIYRVKKDFFPFHLFQFGVLMFPHGRVIGDYLPTYHIATENNDLHTIFISLDEIK
uniref:hypothetical protein n=1 Tax=Algoriphagus sp. TaxID=1872435 RepID=UPI0040481A38